MLRKVLGSKKEELAWYWRRVHKEELPAVCSAANIIRVVRSRRIRWAGNVACTGKGRGLYWVLVVRCDARRPLGMPSVDGGGDGWGNVHSTDLAQDRESGRLL